MLDKMKLRETVDGDTDAQMGDSAPADAVVVEKPRKQVAVKSGLLQRQVNIDGAALATKIYEENRVKITAATEHLSECQHGKVARAPSEYPQIP